MTSRNSTTPRMTRAAVTRAALTGAAAFAAAIALTGCTAILNSAHKVHEEHFADWSEAQDGWVGVTAPSWIPEDATDIRNLATNGEIASVIRVHSASPLPDEGEEVERKGLAFETAGWVDHIDPLPDEVELCGEYEVVAVPGGAYLAWFNGTEQGDLPDE